MGLSLDYSSSLCVSQSVREFIDEASRIESESAERFQKLDEYVNLLRDELKKIDAFKRELPLCMFLLTNAIVAAKEELMKCKKSNSEPVLKEFMPLKKSCRDDKADKGNGVVLNANGLASAKLDDIDKRNGLLTHNHPLMNDSLQIGDKGTMEKELMPLKRCNDQLPSMETKGRVEDRDDSPVLTLCLPDIKNSKEASFSSKYDSNMSSASCCVTNAQQKPVRKQRRCWSQELHRRFVDALHQLGGYKVATPKQIRELMQVDGLTNDEVKSHLQKYRLHHRRVNSTRNTPSTTQRKMSLWASKGQCGESTKKRIFKSNSPEGPLHFPVVEDDEDDDDDGGM